ncbi:MAG: hypothetical protein WCO56_06825 [Verrucomicrobiota bacterium]
MLRFFSLSLTLALLLGSARPARAFSLLGLLETWQVPLIGYNYLNTDIGGPKVLYEGYRWSVPYVYYGFDPSFMMYFGTDGVKAVDEAFRILNALPPVSKWSADLSEFPLSSTHVNYQAQSLGVYDLKSATLGMLIEAMGLAESVRYTFCLRDRKTIAGSNPTAYDYYVIMRNYDPVTWEPSKYVNGVLYSYAVNEYILPIVYADADEYMVEPLDIEKGSVANFTWYSGNSANGGGLGLGQFYSGITRDDAGGLRHLYSRQNVVGEGLIAGASNALAFAEGNGGYTMYFGNVTNNVNQSTTNSWWGGSVFMPNGYRAGLEKINFIKFNWNAGTNISPIWTDRVASNAYSRMISQQCRRRLGTPDILFTATDLGMMANGAVPVTMQRTDEARFQDNHAMNGVTVRAGPGVVVPPLVIQYSVLYPGYESTSYFNTEADAFKSLVWGTFDGTTNAPIIMPRIISVQDLVRRVYNP